MKNCKYICPALCHAIYSSYSKPSALFVNHKKKLSREAASQDDHFAMALNGITVLPLIEKVENDWILQRWYSDDGSVAGKLKTAPRPRQLHKIKKTLRIYCETLQMPPYSQGISPLHSQNNLSEDINQFQGWIQIPQLCLWKWKVLWLFHWRKSRRVKQRLHEKVSTSWEIATKRIFLRDRKCSRKMLFMDKTKPFLAKVNQPPQKRPTRARSPTNNFRRWSEYDFVTTQEKKT